MRHYIGTAPLQCKCKRSHNLRLSFSQIPKLLVNESSTKLYNRAGTGGNCAAVVFLVMLTATAVAQQYEFLNAHNNERAAVGVAGLVWDNKVARYAQTYAEKQRDKGNCALVHSGGPYGENLFRTSASSVSPATAVNLWISEKQYYHYPSNTCTAPPGKSCGHYTQVVWRNSFRLGCASITCNNGGTFVICNYDPRGNIIGQHPY